MLDLKTYIQSLTLEQFPFKHARTKADEPTAAEIDAFEVDVKQCLSNEIPDAIVGVMVTVIHDDNITDFASLSFEVGSNNAFAQVVFNPDGSKEFISRTFNGLEIA